MKAQFTLGFLPTRRMFFSKEAAFKEKQKVREAIGRFAPEIKIVDLEELNSEGLLYSEADAPIAARRFRDAGVDAVFTPHCNFGCEGAVAIACREIGKPILLWGPRDDAPEADGSRLRDSQCGVFATSKVLQRFGVKFAYIVSSRVEDEIFRTGFLRFIAAANTVKHFCGARIGQIGTRPRDFYSVIFNENELLEKFGLVTVPLDTATLFDECRAIAARRGAEFETEKANWSCSMDFSATPDAVDQLVALKMAIGNWAKAEGLSAAAIQCWDSMQKALGVCPCAVNAALADEGFPLVCETDFHGAVSAVLLQYATLRDNPVFIADLTIRHPENDNAELLWHCGPFPGSLLRGKIKTACHFVLPSHAPGVCSGELKSGKVSVVRFDGVRGRYSLFAGSGKIVDGPFNQGTYGYLEVNDWPSWEEKIVKGPYIHHVAGAYCDAVPVLREAVDFIDGLEFDPAEGR